MDLMAATQSFTWADAAGAAVVALAVVALVGFAVAGFVQLRTAKIKAGQEDDLRQLADVVTSVRQLREDPEPDRVGQRGQHPQQLVATEGRRRQCVLLLHV